MDINVAGVPITTSKEQNRRISLLLWGASGAGKTTLAATAPGNKLFIQYDPKGSVCLGEREDCFILDLSSENSNSIIRLKNENNPLGLNKIIKDLEIDTIILDSLTTLSEMALRKAVTEAKGATIDIPGKPGYGVRGSYMRQCIYSLLRLAHVNNLHIIFIAHEDIPVEIGKSETYYQSILLSGKLQSETPIRVAECWHLEDIRERRVISLRSTPFKRPMKTRMFDSKKGIFTWKYNTITQEGEGLTEWFKQWDEGNGIKIPCP